MLGVAIAATIPGPSSSSASGGDVAVGAVLIGVTTLVTATAQGVVPMLRRAGRRQPDGVDNSKWGTPMKETTPLL
jgi:hypothetical protein